MQMGPANGGDVGARRLVGPDKARFIGWRRTGSADEYAATNVNYGVSRLLGQISPALTPVSTSAAMALFDAQKRLLLEKIKVLEVA